MRNIAISGKFVPAGLHLNAKGCKALGVFLFAALLTGCVTAEQHEARRQATIAKIAERCEQFGFRKGTTEFSNCQMEMYKTVLSNEAVISSRPAPPKSNMTCTTIGNTTNCY